MHLIGGITARKQSNLATVAIIPVGDYKSNNKFVPPSDIKIPPNAPAFAGLVSEFAARLTSALSMVGPTLHLNSARLDHNLGPHTSSKLGNFVQRSRVGHFISLIFLHSDIQFNKIGFAMANSNGRRQSIYCI